MAILVVGDIHGKVSAVEAALNTGYPVVFVGDYLDSFTNSPEDSIKCLRLVLQSQRDGLAVALKGNHEISYMDRSQRCSGWNPVIQSHIDADPDLDLTELFDYYEAQGFFISHAGVSNITLRDMDMTFEEYIKGGDFMQVGYRRGGWDRSGGLFWCDWRTEFVPVEGVKQIVGHTHGVEIRENDGNYNIDCIPYEKRSQGYSKYNSILIEGGEVEFFSLDI